MGERSLLTLLGSVEIVLCVVVLCFITFKRLWRDYWALGSFLAVRAVSSIALAFILHETGPQTRRMAYIAYFYVYWLAFAFESILAVFIVYGALRLTTTPLRGLQELGTKVFPWIAGICLALAVGSAFAPYMTSTKYLVAGVSHLERTQSLLTLCVAVFVIFAVRPMGFSYRSKVFGVSLGLAILALNDLVQSAWLTFKPDMHRFYNLVNGFVLCAILAIWVAYFAIREPERREVELSSRSPFVRLNNMALAWFG